MKTIYMTTGMLALADLALAQWSAPVSITTDPGCTI
jgi:hypothetical protein